LIAVPPLVLFVKNQLGPISTGLLLDPKRVESPATCKLRLRTVVFVPNNPAKLGTPLMVIVYPPPSNTIGVVLVSGEMLFETIEFDVRE
jgi:hypothetical protein